MERGFVTRFMMLRLFYRRVFTGSTRETAACNTQGAHRAALHIQDFLPSWSFA